MQPGRDIGRVVQELSVTCGGRQPRQKRGVLLPDFLGELDIRQFASGGGVEQSGAAVHCFEHIGSLPNKLGE